MNGNEPSTTPAIADVAALQEEVLRLRGIIIRTNSASILTTAQTHGIEEALRQSQKGNVRCARLTPPSTFQFSYPPQPAPVFNAGLRDKQITLGELAEELLLQRVFARNSPHPVCQGTSAIYDEMKTQKEQRELVDGALALAHRFVLTREETRQMLGLNATTDSREEERAVAKVFGLDTRSPVQRWTDSLRDRWNGMRGDVRVHDPRDPASANLMISFRDPKDRLPEGVTLSSRMVERLQALQQVSQAIAATEKELGSQDWSRRLRLESNIAPFGQKVSFQQLEAVPKEILAKNGIDLMQEYFAPRRPLDWLLKPSNDTTAISSIQALAGAVEGLARQPVQLDLPPVAERPTTKPRRQLLSFLA